MDVIYIQFYLLFELQYSVNIKDLQVAIAQGFHLFPFRTEKLSLVTPMVLRISGRVGSRRFTEKSSVTEMFRRIFCLYTLPENTDKFHNHTILYSTKWNQKSASPNNWQGWTFYD